MAKSPRRRRLRATFVHPITSARITIEARSRGALDAAKERWWFLREDLRRGRISPVQFDEAVELLRTGRPPARGVPTLGDAWALYTKTLSNPGTKSKAASVWKRHLSRLADEPLAGFHDGRLAELVAEWQRAGHAPKTITHTLWSFLAAAVRHAKRARLVERLPWDEFRPPPARVRRRPAAAEDVDELACLVAAARAIDDEDRTRGWARHALCDLHRRVLVLALCGLRNGEGAGLGWDHVDLDRGTITIAFQALDQWRKHFPGATRPMSPVKNPGARGPRVQRLHLDALAALVEQRDELVRLGWYRDNGPVFPTRGGAWRNNANCIYPEDVHLVARRAGRPNAALWVTHSLRHSFATLETRLGGDPIAAQRRIGHASLAQLEQYLHGGEGAPSAIPPLPTLARAAIEGAQGKAKGPKSAALSNIASSSSSRSGSSSSSRASDAASSSSFETSSEERDGDV